MADTPRPTDAELLAELAPLAAVIADKIRTVPVRLGPGGTDDLISEITLAVAVYCGQHVLSADARALATPAHPTETSWLIETPRKGAWRRWSGCRDTREQAHDDYANTVEWGGTRQAYRLVRVTTTYAVEAEHAPEPS
ncbi:hypothetical protein [Streptomyces sp. NPDC017941]|uniref:hypothetical protein n=1 Tax=Streptomyces sp. NPDC017941 TaxID=3365018 RepID=UPI0037A78059